MSMRPGAPLLEARGIGKRFAGVAALRNCDLVAHGGEVHALVGANGAGKSTLMSLISGAQTPSEGEILVDGKPVRFTDPIAAQACGVATVYQEFSLVPQLSVARNIYLGREPQGAFGLVDREELRRKTADVLARSGCRIDPNAEAGSLRSAPRQIAALAPALTMQARILILDEPTAVLSLAEQENLFSIIATLRASGMLILYVSHHLSEVLAIADRVTVLRDGEKVATRDATGLDVDMLVELMIGRSAAYERAASRAARPDRDPFTIRYHAGDVPSRFEIAPGEIIGIAGVVGAGRTTFARALAGAGGPGAKVEVRVRSRTLDLSSPRSAMRSGIVYLTEDRKRDGLFANLDIVANATASALPALGTAWFRNIGRERRKAADMLERLHLVAASLSAPIARLSGGNQQKGLIGRALMTEPRLLVCDEPTRGVDVGAKAEIYQILRRLADSGVAILIVSSETEELLAITDRIAVMRERSIVALMNTRDADEAKLLLAASGAIQSEVSNVPA